MAIKYMPFLYKASLYLDLELWPAPAWRGLVKQALHLQKLPFSEPIGFFHGSSSVTFAAASDAVA